MIQTTSRQQQTERTLLDWLRMEYGIEKPSNKLLALTGLDSNSKGECRRKNGAAQRSRPAVRSCSRNTPGLSTRRP